MKKSIRVYSLLFLITGCLCANGLAATYYMATTGSNSNSGAESSPWLTLQYSLQHISGGDTLILEDGAYTGNANAMGSVTPPIGTSGTYTTIKARNDGNVLFDGENARWMFYIANGGVLMNCYWKFQGIVWCRTTESNIYIQDCAYVKFMNCGAYDAPNNNYMNFSIGGRCRYILLEGCYAYGAARYKFCTGAQYVVLRNCVGRMDYVNAADPMAVFSIYGGSDTEIQNCIAIDSDQTASYTSGEWEGSFFVPSTSGDANRVYFTNCIGLNNTVGGVTTTGNTSYAAKNCKFTNCVIWNCSKPSSTGLAVNYLRGLNDAFNHCTFGVSTIYSDYFSSYNGIGYPNNTMLNNSIFYGISGSGHNVLYDVETQDYNAYYNNSVANANLGVHDKMAVNPLYNSLSNSAGALKYIIQIEPGSNLSGLASDAGDIGANIKSLIGTSGTLWGETGYDTDTGVSMWPFPNEDVISTKMKAYNVGGVSGNRGFCADGSGLYGGPITLTSYIWEYLGNVLPDDMYGLQISTLSLTSGTTGLLYSKTVQAAHGTSPYTWSISSGSLPGGMSLDSLTGTLSGTCNTAGTYSFVIKVEDSAAAQDTQSLSLVINDPGNSNVVGASGGGGGGGCFIATAVYGDRNAEEVVVLTKFREQVLMKHCLGRLFVKIYYRSSPPIARYIVHRKLICWAIKRIVLYPIVHFASLSVDKQ